MSRHHYEAMHEIAAAKEEHNWPYYSLIMAAMRLGDTENQEKLRAMWPWAWEDMWTRYHAPGGWLPTDPGMPQEIRELYIRRGRL